MRGLGASLPLVRSFQHLPTLTPAFFALSEVENGVERHGPITSTQTSEQVYRQGRSRETRARFTRAWKLWTFPTPCWNFSWLGVAVNIICLFKLVYYQQFREWKGWAGCPLTTYQQSWEQKGWVGCSFTTRDTSAVSCQQWFILWCLNTQKIPIYSDLICLFLLLVFFQIIRLLFSEAKWFTNPGD